MDVAQAAPNTVILAEDEASLYLQATTTAVWAPQGHTPVVTIDPGRAKTSFYGALNLQTGAEIVMQASTMNSETTVLYLQQILTAIPHAPILLLWDHARWHFGQPVRNFLAENTRLQVMHFPVAAPDCNPQEHVWKATRRAVSHNHACCRLPDLAAKFESHLKSSTFPCSLLHNFAFDALCPMFI